MRPLILLAVLGMAACDAAPTAPPAEPAPVTAPAASAPSMPAQTPATVTLTPAGPEQALSADADDDLQLAASVVKLHPIEDQNAKLFGTAGGDPAVNGLYTYAAFFAGPAEGWRVYRLGDFEDFRVTAITRGRIDLEISESVLNDTTGRIESRNRRAILAFTGGEDGAPPTNVTLTPAR